MLLKYIKAFAVVYFNAACIVAQNTRITDKNAIGWFTNFTTIKFAGKWSGHLEYQWRRENFIKDWQQSLFRTGINYHVNNKLTVRLGYARIETFPYGDIPLQAAGKRFPEHRTYQMATITDNTGIPEMSHRFMLEQRWIGRYSNAALNKPDDFLFSNRVRYMYRMQKAIGKKKIAPKTPYAAVYDEIFLGFGKNVNENVFDQNRLAVLLGYHFNKKWRVEGGFFQQIVQLGREVNNRNVFQYNNGIILNTFLNFDLSKARPKK
jgi:Protein of unknown function (DUF2490)